MNRRLKVPLTRSGLGVAAVTAAAVLSGCSHAGNAASGALSVQPSASAAASASPAAATPPVIVGVTTAGALVTLNPTTGVTEQTLVASGVLGGEVTVSPGGMAYFAVKDGNCSSHIEAIPVRGGTPAVLGTGLVPAVSPDGSKLAYSGVPPLGPGCVQNETDLTQLYYMKIRTLSSGSMITLPIAPPGQGSGLPQPISHLSWSADNRHLAV